MRFVRVLAAVALALTLARPALAWQGEGGTHYCTYPILGYVHFRYNDIADVLPPGSSVLYLYRENDGNWHTHERDGAAGGGYWEVVADPALDFANTYPGCRRFG